MTTIIDFETHFFTQTTVNYLSKRNVYPLLECIDQDGSYNLRFTQSVFLPHKKPLMAKLLDISNGRIAAMDQNKVDVQILSLTVPTGVECLDYHDAPVLAHDSNDELFAATKSHPTRLKGFAAISPNNIPAGVKELERSITQLGFVGWMTHSNFGKDEYLDAKKYWPLLEAAQSLDIPVYLHPTVPNMSEFAAYGFATAGAGLGFQFDAALCLMRMIYSGVFDQFPKLTIILGHLGETLPFLMERLDFVYRAKDIAFGPEKPNLKRLPSQVLRENVYVTTSGRFYTPALEYTIRAMGEDKVLFATDYPMESLIDSVEFVTKSGLSVAVIDKICSGNAQKLGVTCNLYKL